MNQNDFYDKLTTLKSKSQQKLSDLCTEAVSAIKLSTRALTFSFSFSNRDEYLLSQFRLAALIHKEVKRRIPYLPTQFFSVDRRGVTFMVVREEGVVKKYVDFCCAKMLQAKCLFLHPTVFVDQTFTGYTATGKVVVVRFDYQNSCRNSGNPYRIFLYLRNLIEFACNLSRYAPCINPLTDDEVAAIIAFQKLDRSRDPSEPARGLETLPQSTLPYYSTQRMLRKNERYNYRLT